MNLPRLWRTARHLRPEQIWGRARFRLARPRPDTAPAPPSRRLSGPWAPPPRRQASLIGPGHFRFLNCEGDLSARGWDDPALPKLWRYNQHYFDDLNAEGAEVRREWHAALIEDWIAANPPGHGTGWEPYPTSLRIVNWIKHALAGNALSEAAVHSLSIQARWLTRRLEWHLLGNHLFADAKALVFAGLWFDDDEAEGWLQTGRRILAWEIPEQILPDGGQFELSPMYQALAVEDVLDLVNLARAFGREDLAAEWMRPVPAMLAWLATMAHPDGRIAFFNDAAFGIAPENAEIKAYAETLGFCRQAPRGPLTWLEDSGYARLETGPAVLFADMARIGPDYLPGHAHADTLSFELSLFGQRVIVNSGTSVYGTGAERLRQRGTAAHSTVCVAGRDSSEVWDGFRVGRRARIVEATVTQQADKLIAEGAHDGYRYLPGRPMHHRRWKLGAGALLIEDWLSDPHHPAEARFNLHPAVAIHQDAPDRGHLRFADDLRVGWRAGPGNTRIEATTWHPEFGLSQPTSCLVVALEAGRAALQLNWG